MQVARSCFRQRPRSASWHASLPREVKRALVEEGLFWDPQPDSHDLPPRRVFKYTRCSDVGCVPSSDAESCCGESLVPSPSDSEQCHRGVVVGRHSGGRHAATGTESSRMDGRRPLCVETKKGVASSGAARADCARLQAVPGREFSSSRSSSPTSRESFRGGSPWRFLPVALHASSPVVAPLKSKVLPRRPTGGEAKGGGGGASKSGFSPNFARARDDADKVSAEARASTRSSRAPSRSASAGGWVGVESLQSRRATHGKSRASARGCAARQTHSFRGAEAAASVQDASSPSPHESFLGQQALTAVVRGGGSRQRMPSCQEVESCASCGCLRFNTRGSAPLSLGSSTPFDSSKKEVATLGVNWGDPMSFWFVETARDEVVAREFQRLFRLNSSVRIEPTSTPRAGSVWLGAEWTRLSALESLVGVQEAALAVQSFRLFVTIMVIVAAIKYGMMTYFPPENYVAFTSFFCADVVIWIFFVGDALLRSRSLGATRFWRDRQSCYDLFLLAVGLAALVLRLCVLADVGGLGERVFSPDKFARTDGIVNAFTVGDVQTAMLALDTIQLTRVYRLAFSCRELFFLTRSILHSLKSLQWTALFVVVIIYSCAVFCTWAYHDEDDAEMRLLWGNLVLSMFTLFTVLTLEGWNSVANSTAEKHPYSRIFFVLYICFTTLTLLNIVTGIILDAYVDMSSRLSKEATYQENLEKDSRNEKVLMAAFEKTCFLVCLRPPVACSSTEGLHSCHSDAPSEPHQCASPSSAWEAAGCPHGTGCWVGAACRTSQETALLRPVEEGDVCGICASRRTQHFSSMNWNGGGGSAVGVGVKSALLERKATGGLSEDSTAKSATESDPFSHQRSSPEVVVQAGAAVAPLNKCIRYLRVAGHQPVDILRHPLVQEALQATRIPFYQAFDVLNMYHLRGIQYVTVKEFAEACSRVGGVATGRQLLLAQLELQQKLCAVDRRVRWLCRQLQQKAQLCASASLKTNPTLHEASRWPAS